jgi:hypothetical protein
MLTSELNSLRFFDTMIGGVMYISVLVLAACLVVIALLAIYVPTVYIRKTNVMIHLLEQIGPTDINSGLAATVGRGSCHIQRSLEDPGLPTLYLATRTDFSERYPEGGVPGDLRGIPLLASTARGSPRGLYFFLLRVCVK